MSNAVQIQGLPYFEFEILGLLLVLELALLDCPCGIALPELDWDWRHTTPSIREAMRSDKGSEVTVPILW